MATRWRDWSANHPERPVADFLDHLHAQHVAGGAPDQTAVNFICQVVDEATAYANAGAA